MSCPTVEGESQNKVLIWGVRIGVGWGGYKMGQQNDNIYKNNPIEIYYNGYGNTCGPQKTPLRIIHKWRHILREGGEAFCDDSA